MTRRFITSTLVLVVAACGIYGEDDPAPVIEPAPDGGHDASAADSGVLVPLPPGPKCPGAGLSCIPVAPNGWDGPFVLYDGNPANAPDCPIAMPAIAIEGHRDLGAVKAHTCTACSCGDAKGAKCDSATFTTWATPDCTGANNSPKPVGAACQLTPETFPGAHSIVGVANGGSCDPMQATLLDNPAPSFAYATRACGASLVNDGCNTNFVCASDPLPPFNAKHCITQKGDVTCPGAPYSVKTTTLGTVVDTRACAPCACGAATNVQCTGAIDGYSDDTCGGTKTNVAYPLACKAGLAGYKSVKFIAAGTASGGSCAPSGGTPTGSVRLTDIVTICCAP